MAKLTANPQDMRVPDPGVRALFEIENRWQAWMDVEVALAAAQADMGIIPAAAAQEIEAKADFSKFDQERLADGFLTSGHTLTPLVWELSRLCDGDAGGFVHWGATTQNIVQTGDLLVLRALQLIDSCKEWLEVSARRVSKSELARSTQQIESALGGTLF